MTLSYKLAHPTSPTKYLSLEAIVRIDRIILIIALILAVTSSARAGVSSMQMVTPNDGWATTGQRFGPTDLYWTADGGVHWKNITPSPFVNSETGKLRAFSFGGEPESIADVFFLDAHKGWVLFCCGWDETTKTVVGGLPRYDLAMTTDAGATWSIARITIPAEAHLVQADGGVGGTVRFADALHGWINLTGCATHSCSGTLLSTSDGGRTWQAPSDDYVSAGAFCLVTSGEGWQLSPPSWFGNDTWELSVTRNGGKSWKEVSVPIPDEIRRAVGFGSSTLEVNYHDLPTFENSERGFLPVTYMAEGTWNSVIVLFETVDGGRTWTPIRTLTNLVIRGGNDSYTVAAADSTLIAATASTDDKRATLSRVGPEGKADIDITSYLGGWRGITYLQLSFATRKQGWMVANAGLLSTTDGGASWTKLTPGVDQQQTPAASQPMSPSVEVASMQLLTPNVGWALSLRNSALYWTEDGGVSWKTISPAGIGIASYQFPSAFFIDTKRGWLLFRKGRGFQVLSTSDAGANWSTSDLAVPGADVEHPGYLSGGQIYFMDSVHGWVCFTADIDRVSRNSLLMTSDGGRTWQPAPNDMATPPGSIRFVTPMDGWLLSRSRVSLCVTRDGAKSWQKVSLEPPKEAYPAAQPSYDLPTFKDSEHGLLPVIYYGSSVAKANAVLFASDDGGRTWKPDRTLADVRKHHLAMSCRRR